MGEVDTVEILKTANGYLLRPNHQCQALDLRKTMVVEGLGNIEGLANALAVMLIDKVELDASKVSQDTLEKARRDSVFLRG